MPEFHVWRPATLLQVAGPDAFTFLQGQFSNDLRLLGEAGSVYGLWLNQKGKVLADSFVVGAETPDAFWVVSYFSRAVTVFERLTSHLIADEVEIEDQTERWFGLTQFNEPERAERETGAIVFQGRRGGGTAWEKLTLVSPAAAGTALSGGAMERRRLEAGIPAVPVDLGPGDLPQEGGLEREAISFNKGCYLGQEVMARLQSMGTPRRRLFQVEGAGDPPRPGTPLVQGDRACGELRSTAASDAGFIGLAMLPLAHLKANEPVMAGSTAIRVLG